MEDGLLADYESDFTEDALQQDMSGNCTCDMQPNVTVVFNVPICNLPLVPAWVLAVAVGVMGGQTLQRLSPSIVGTLSYSITFFMYAAMITAGLVTHCIFLVECGDAPVSQGFADAAYLDASLTCCIAFSFLFNGLVDLKLISERNASTWLVMGFTYVGLFYANFTNLVSTNILYRWSIIIGCSGYMLSQMVVLCRGPCRLRPLLYLAAAGITGGVCFLLFVSYLCLLCTVLGAWSIEGVWYYGSDVTMFFILLYTLATRESSPIAPEKPPLAFTPVAQPLKVGHPVK